MPMEVLRTETLHLVRDGMLREVIDEKLAAIYKDCVERPTLQTARKLKIELNITPTGESPLDAVNIEFKVKEDVPAQGFKRDMKAIRRPKGFGVTPDTDSVDMDPNQNTFENH